MKKFRIVLLVSIALALGIGVTIISQNLSKNNGSSLASAKAFDSVSEICNESDLVIKGKVLDGYEENERKLDSQTIQERLFQVEVQKVVENSTDEDIQKGDVITLAVTMNAQINGAELTLSDGIKDINPGNYLLFLNSFKDGEEMIFLNNSPNHLYKGNGNKFYNISSKALEVITEEDISNVKK